VITFNCQGFEPRKLLGQASVVLPTVVADEDGALKQVRRQTVVNVYPVLPGEVAHIYEMGIPVVETGDRWHYDVQQRVPVNWERDNVSKSYVKAVRTAVLDVMSKEITQEDAQSSWVQSSLDKAAPEAVQDVIKKQFGSRAVIYDPSDLEGSKLAVSKGYTVVHGGTFSRETWGNIRKSGALLPAGQVTPSPKAYSDDPDAPVEELLPREKWSEGMLKVEALIQRLGDHLLNSKVEVRYTLGNVGFAAAFGRGTSLLVSGATFTFNYRRLGRKWFDRDNRDEDLLSLIIHEFGHFYSGDHLAEEYHEALCDLGARMARLALKDPQIFSV
jgi:hypothetical protein